MLTTKSKPYLLRKIKTHYQSKVTHSQWVNQALLFYKGSDIIVITEDLSTPVQYVNVNFKPHFGKPFSISFPANTSERFISKVSIYKIL